jgi:hypothetical protein
MSHDPNQYSFSALYGTPRPNEPRYTSLVYLLALVDSPKSEILRLDKAHFVLSYLYEVEEQIATAVELLSVQGRHFPKPYYPQTPVMVTKEWSPISAMLEGGLNPLGLVRQPRRWACASGIWEPMNIENVRSYQECESPEQLFWSVLDKVANKARARGLLISLISSIGWDYESNIGMPRNLSLAEAEQADRVVWQRTPIPSRGSF